MKNNANSSRRVFIKQLAVSTAGVAIGTNLLAKQEDASRWLVSPTGRSKFDGDQSVLIPVQVHVKPGYIQLIAGGETIHFTGDLVQLDTDKKLDSKWTVAEREFTTFSLNITAHSAALLRNISWFSGEWEHGVEQVIQSTALMDNVLFLRKGEISFFISLDFPFSHIDKRGISYPPYEYLTPGQEYFAHSITIGACRLSGQQVNKFDSIEIEAVSTYIERRFAPRFERPMFLSCSITNRMTDVRDGRIFYSMYDNPTLSLNPLLVEEDLRLCAETGIEYYQVFEGVFDWPDKEKTGSSLKRLQKKARDINVRMGDYAVPQGLYCPHFNYEHRSVNHPEWLIVGPDGKPAGPECLACKEYEKMLREPLVAHNREFGLDIICLDFLNIHPCYATNHNHEPGDVYQQVLALVRLMKLLNATNPNFLVWSNSGNWIELMPKLTWFNQNVYLTDPHIRAYSPHLNVLKILGDGRREQMVSVHESHFVPYRSFTNFEYYLAPDSRLSDTKIYKYSFLQGLAVTPNIGLGELRTFLARIPKKNAEEAVAFISHWLGFIRDNFEAWKHTRRIGDPPGIGAAEAYSHVFKNHGFLVLVNQNPFPRTTKFTLDASIGLNAGDMFILNEVYPRECLIAEQQLPIARRGDSITCIQSANSIRIIEIKPALGTELPAIYGLPFTTERLPGGYRFALRAPQGKKAEIGLVLPSGQTLYKVIARQVATVPMYTFSVRAQVVSQISNLARLEVQFPRERAPYELTRWIVNPGNIKLDLPVSDHTGFMGALVHNAFTEDYEIQLDVYIKAAKVASSILPAGSISQKLPSSMLPLQKRLTYTTHFMLPFIERYGEDRNCNNDAIIELAFADPEQVGKIEVCLNGKPVTVKRYRNPKQPAYSTFYVKLAGNVQPGQVELTMNVEYLHLNETYGRQS
jgi:hypothetical protein